MLFFQDLMYILKGRKKDLYQIIWNMSESQSSLPSFYFHKMLSLLCFLLKYDFYQKNYRY